MSNTIPDITALITGYVDVYALTGITVGNPILLQNKSTSVATVQIKPFQPASSSQDGVFLVANGFLLVDQGAEGCWIKGNGRISVQEIS